MEDFVPFDLAVKLKDKGFNIPFYFYYRTDDELLHHAHITNPLVYGDKVDDEVIIAPTISQVLKWLREEKKIHIELWVSGKRPIKWHHTIHTLNNQGERKGWSSGEIHNTYEQAALAGVAYCLYNLI